MRFYDMELTISSFRLDWNKCKIFWEM